MVSRRFFLAGSAGFALAPEFVAPGVEVPTMLDHILLGCSDLGRGIEFVATRTMVLAAFGGVHPGRGTRNALLSLRKQTGLKINPGPYLEIIAPDPQQSDASDLYGLQKLSEPRLVGWAMRSGDILGLADRLAKAGIAADGPTPGSRKRIDGELLQWKTLHLRDNASGLLPFFIEWSADTIHPSVDAPRGCHLDGFSLSTPNVSDLNHICTQLDLEVPIKQADKPQLHARIAGPSGKVMDISS